MALSGWTLRAYYLIITKDFQFFFFLISFLLFAFKNQSEQILIKCQTNFPKKLFTIGGIFFEVLPYVRVKKIPDTNFVNSKQNSGEFSFIFFHDKGEYLLKYLNFFL